MDRRRRRSGYQLLGPRKAGQCRVVGCGKYGTMLLHLQKHIRLNHSQMSPAEHSALPPPDPRKRVVAPSARGRTREACEIPTCPKYGDPTTKLKRHVEGRHGISMEVYHGYLKYLSARRSRQVDWESLITENGQSIGFSKVQCEAGDGGIHEPKAATQTRQDRRALELEPDFLLSALLEVFSEHTVTEAQNAGTGCRFAENPDANTSIFRLVLNSKDCTVVKNSSNALLNSYLMREQLHFCLTLNYKFQCEKTKRDFFSMIEGLEFTMLTFGPTKYGKLPGQPYPDFSDDSVEGFSPRYGMAPCPKYVTFTCTECAKAHNVPATNWDYRWKKGDT